MIARPRPGAAVLLGDRGVGLGERLEHALELRLGHADPGVFDRDGQPVAGVVAHAPGRERDLAVVAELAGVGQQIHQHLAQLGLVRLHGADVGRAVNLETVAVAVDQRTHRGRDVLDQRGNVERLDEQFGAPGFDLGQIEDVVDQRQQVLAGRADLVQVGDHALVTGVLGLFDQHLAVADDRVERCPQLVAHVGQELALGAARGLGLAARAQQLADVVVERHQPLALPVDVHRHAGQLDVDERAVLAPALADAMCRLLLRLHRVADRLGQRLLGVDQRVEILADRLVEREAEQVLEGGIERGDVAVDVDGDDRDRAVDHHGLEVLLLAAGLGEQPRVLDGDRGLWREQVEQPQILGAELAIGIAVDARERADQTLADQQGRDHHGMGFDAHVLGRAARPVVVRGDDDRLVRLGDPPHRAFAAREPGAGRILAADVVARDHDQLFFVFLVNGQLAAGAAHQGDRASQHGLQQTRQLQFRREVRDRL